MKCSRIDNPGGEETRLFNNRELKQQRRRRLRKRQLKSEVALPQTFSRLFHQVSFVKCWQMFLDLNSERLYQSSGKEKESRLVFTSSTKREIRHFHVVVVQRRAKKCTKRRDARAKFGLLCQSKPIAFLPFSFTSASSLLKLLYQE